MPSRRVAIVGIVAIAVSSIALLSQKTTTTEQRPAVNVAKTEKGVSSALIQVIQQPAAIAAKSQAPAQAPQVSEKEALVGAYSRIREGRPFVLQAWQRPQDGGRLYASAVSDVCLGLLNSGLNPNVEIVGSEFHLAAIAAHDRIQALCGQFTREELIRYGGRALLNDKEDVYMRGISDLATATKSRDVSTRSVATQTVLRYADPLMISNIGMRLSLYTDDRGGSYLYFDGEKRSLQDGAAIASAYYLLPCALGFVCDANEPDLMIRCLAGSGCFSSRFEVALKEMAGNDPEKFSQIRSYYERLALAVRNQDVKKFVPAQ